METWYERTRRLFHPKGAVWEYICADLEHKFDTNKYKKKPFNSKTLKAQKHQFEKKNAAME